MRPPPPSMPGNRPMGPGPPMGSAPMMGPPTGSFPQPPRGPSPPMGTSSFGSNPPPSIGPAPPMMGGFQGPPGGGFGGFGGGFNRGGFGFGPQFQGFNRPGFGYGPGLPDRFIPGHEHVRKLVEGGPTYQFNIQVVSIFFGSISLLFLFYGWASPYWFMLNTRAYATTPELRVLGLTHIVESMKATGFLEFEVNKYSLRSRKEEVCSLSSRGEEHAKELNCGIDCKDMELMAGVRVVCDDDPDFDADNRGVYAIPIKPAERIWYSATPEARESWTEKTETAEWKKRNDIEILRFGCEKRIKWPKRVKCPLGYKQCDKDFAHQCMVGSKTWTEPTCCVDHRENKYGSTMYNVSKAPTYLHVYGWASWQVPSLRQEDSKTMDVGDGSHWCPISTKRCEILSEFTRNGEVCTGWITLGLVITGTALVVSMVADYNRGLIVSLLYIVSFIIVIVSIGNYHVATGAAIQRTMTPVDEFNRPYIHPMKEYNNKDRDITKLDKETRVPAEWTYYYLNARVDYATTDPHNPQGFSMLWASILAGVSCWFSLAAAFVNLELWLSSRNSSGTAQTPAEQGAQPPMPGAQPPMAAGPPQEQPAEPAESHRSPLQVVLQMVLFPLCIVPMKLKYVIDEKIAPYPVMFVYPWQKLYPCAFTAGRKMMAPFDQIWDCCICLPVHLIRAIWDYVSCQDICSPSEKEVLREKGVTHDRLQSLLCSRRSYFVLMAGMGVVSLVVNVDEMINISNGLTYLRQAAAIEDRYPLHHCARTNGDCPILDNAIPDAVGLAHYIKDMTIRGYGRVFEGSNVVEVIKALIKWLGSFLAVFCAVGALSNWTDFARSRRFCLCGWIFMALSPIFTSAFAEAAWVDWDHLGEDIARNIAEVAEELMFFMSHQPCHEATQYVRMALDKGVAACKAAESFVLRPWRTDDLKTTCMNFQEFYDTHSDQLLEDADWVCRNVDLYMKDGHRTKEDIYIKIKSHLPQIIEWMRIILGAEIGVKNMLTILPAIMSMAPALMQGGLMVKNMVPQQTLPSILTSLPWAFCILFWVQYQAYYQILGGKFFLVACICVSFCPLLYYIFSKHYRVVQPMCDQQSVTLTFRIWYYALVSALVFPYIMLIVYITWMNDFMADQLYEATIGWMFEPTALEIAQLISGVLMGYAYSLQAGIDWFVDELVTHHTASHAPVVIAAAGNSDEAQLLQSLIGTSVDIDAIDKGEYVVGGLGDCMRMYPKAEGTWSQKSKIYATSVVFKDSCTLDCLAGHIYSDDDLPRVLAAARKPWYNLMRNPPEGAFFINEAGEGEIAVGEITKDEEQDHVEPLPDSAASAGDQSSEPRPTLRKRQTLSASGPLQFSDFKNRQPMQM